MEAIFTKVVDALGLVALEKAWTKLRGAPDYRALLDEVLVPAASDLPGVRGKLDTQVAGEVRRAFTPRRRDARRCWDAFQRDGKPSKGLTPVPNAQNLGWDYHATANDYDRLAFEKLRQAAARHNSPLRNLYAQVAEQTAATGTGVVLSPATLAVAVSRVAWPSTLNVKAHLRPDFVVRRQEISAFEQFLEDPTQRWCVIHGPMRVGKSAFLEAVAASASTEWTVIALDLRSNAWSSVAQWIATHLPDEHVGQPWQRLLVVPWVYPPADVQGLLIAVEVNETITVSQAALEFEELERAVREELRANVRVVVSCTTSTWERLRASPPFSSSHGLEDRVLDVVEIPLGRFESDDLRTTLMKLRWVELVQHRYINGQPNPTREALHDMIHEPVMWRVFADLRGSDEWDERLSPDWGSLVVRLGSDLVKKVSRSGSIDEDATRTQLAKVARWSMDHECARYRVSKQALGQGHSELNVGSQDPSRSIYRAAVVTGLLDETGVPGTQMVEVTFRLPELGSYFLSFSLEEGLLEASEEGRRELLVQWISKSGTWEPVLDGLLLLLGRPSVDEQLRTTVLDVLCESWTLNHEVVFGLAPSTVVTYLMHSIGQSTNRSISASEGLRTVPLMPETIPVIKQSLRSLDPKEVVNAARLAGTRRLSGLVPELLDALIDPPSSSDDGEQAAP